MKPAIVKPERGFPVAEFEQRTENAQRMMKQQGLDALLFTTEPNVRYFSGFFSQFWHSPTRPWYLIVPAAGKPIAIIPSIGEVGMGTTWIEDIRTWPAPQPDDDGMSLLIQAMKEQIGQFGKIGMKLGHHSQLRMPAAHFKQLSDALLGTEVEDCTQLITDLRNVKSDREVAKIEYICQMTSDAFIALQDNMFIGETEREICRKMRIDLLQRGADETPFMVAASGGQSYSDIIMGPLDKACEEGDILIIDTGTTYDGYFCDFDRNWAFGSATDLAKRAYEVTYAATDAGFAAAKPGATCADLYNAMSETLIAGGSLGNNIGRVGHGLGIQLTEGPSNTPTDQTVLKPGMVMTLEPGMEFAPGCQMVHEENIVITEEGARWLTKRAAPELPIV
jgi:Xaa-Pro dipeptidase